MSYICKRLRVVYNNNKSSTQNHPKPVSTGSYLCVREQRAHSYKYQYRTTIVLSFQLESATHTIADNDFFFFCVVRGEGKNMERKLNQFFFVIGIDDDSHLGRRRQLLFGISLNLGLATNRLFELF